MRVFDQYSGKRVFITGHTGFKGTWLTKIVLNAGAIVTGYATEPPTDPSLFYLTGLEREKNLTSIIADVRDYERMVQAVKECKPDYVFHLAAQPIVRESYRDPVGTYATNVMGTVNLLEAIRKYAGSCPDKVISVLNVTTDKVYENKEWCWGYREDEPLDGYDPYSNSKSCSELVTHSYKSSFFDGTNVRVSTARAGNVIGGGDFSADRIIPDCIRAVQNGEDIIVRNPHSTRPYQHVLEPLAAYLMIAASQYEDIQMSGYYNVGPDESDCYTTGALVSLFCEKWNVTTGQNVRWIDRSEPNAPHEANFLKLDCSKLKSVFGWQPRWSVETAMERIVEWTRCWFDGGDVAECMDRQIEDFIKMM